MPPSSPSDEARAARCRVAAQVTVIVVLKERARQLRETAELAKGEVPAAAVDAAGRVDEQIVAKMEESLHEYLLADARAAEEHLAAQLRKADAEALLVVADMDRRRDVHPSDDLFEVGARYILAYLRDADGEIGEASGQQ